MRCNYSKESGYFLEIAKQSERKSNFLSVEV